MSPSPVPQPALDPSLCDLTLRIAGMSCAACQNHVQRAMAAVPGVRDVTVDLLAHRAHVSAPSSLDTQLLAAAVRNAGYDVLMHEPAREGAETDAAAPSSGDEPVPEHRKLGLRALLALVAGAVAMVLSMPLMAGGRQAGTDVLDSHVMRLAMALIPRWLAGASADLLRWILLGLTLGTMIFAAPEIYRAAWRAARHRATNMNTLVALGTLVAFAASTYATVTSSVGRPSTSFHDVYFEAVIFILAFLLLGRWLEARARSRATASLRAFAHTETGNARWITDGSPPELESLLSAPETLLPLDALAVGDIVRVLPGDRVPLDGVVLAGRSSVNESMLTGEPLPVVRGRGDKVFSGTLNLDGPLLLRATALGADSMQAQMARLLERARATRAPLQRLADRVSAVFVPVVLSIATLTFAVWAFVDNVGPHPVGYGRALSLAIAVLVVACPCALGLAVPAAVAVSLGTAARLGILIKGGEALERLATADMVAFDKTGTLTEGRPQIIAFELAGAPFPTSASPKATEASATLLSYAVAVEAASTHPLADAVRVYAAARKISAAPGVTEARILPGVGAEAIVDGHRVAVGNACLLLAGVKILPVPAEFAHTTPMYLLLDGQLGAAMYATDTLRASAKAALGDLTSIHAGTALLTGDTPEAANAVAGELGISQVRAKLLPADKLAAITALQGEGHRVAMVGDGLNDAAALAHADVGIAVASGTDLAREAGHVLLMQHDLRLVPQAIRLARRTRRLMRQNLGFALLYNVLGIPLAAGVLLPRFGLALSPAFASAAMALSSVSVLLNSLRLAKAR